MKVPKNQLTELEDKFVKKFNTATKSLDLWTGLDSLWVLYPEYLIVAALPEWFSSKIEPQNHIVDPEVVNLAYQLGESYQIIPAKLKKPKLPGLDLDNWQLIHAAQGLSPRTSSVTNPKFEEVKESVPWGKRLVKADIHLSDQEIRGHNVVSWYQTGRDVVYLWASDILEVFADRTLPPDVQILNLRDNPQESISTLRDFFQSNQGQDIISDLETAGKSPDDFGGLNQFTGMIRLLQVKSKKSDTVLIFDFGQRDQRCTPESFEEFAQVYRQYAYNHLWVYHNATFDLRWVHHHFGVDTRKVRVRCTLNTSKVIWSGILSVQHNLKAVAQRFGVECHDKAAQKRDWGSKLYPADYRYAAGDVSTLCKVDTAQLKNEMVHTNPQAVELTNKLINVVQSLNMSGYPADLSQLKQVYQETLETQSALEACLGLWWGLWEPSKNQQVIDSLSSEDPSLELTDCGMGTLKEIGSELAWTVMNLRGINTRLNYLGNMIKSQVPTIPNRSFTLYSATNPQASGRVSTSQYYTLRESDIKRGAEPFGFNGLNPSKDSRDFDNIPSIRERFNVSPDHQWGSADLSGCHLRVALFLSGQLDVLDQICNSDDGHAHTSVAIAQEVGGIFSPYQTLEAYYEARSSEDPVVGLLRELAKTAIYSIINFCTGASLQSSLSEKEIFLSLEICNQIVKAVWGRVPKIKEYVTAITREASKGVVFSTPGCRKPSTSYAHYRSLYTNEMEKAYKMAIKEWGIDSKKTSKLADRPIGYCLVTGLTGRHRYFPVYERVSYKGSTPKVYRSVSPAAVASHLWSSVEGTIMSSAAIRFQEEYILPKKLPLYDLAIIAFPYDELCFITPASIGLETATALASIMEEEWTKVLGKNVPGVTTAPKKMLSKPGGSWRQVH